MPGTAIPPPFRVAAAASLWGLWSLVFRPAEAHTPGLSASTEALVTMATVFLCAAPFAWRGTPQRPSTRTLALVAALGLVDAFNVLCFFAAMQHTTVALAVLSHYLAPILVALAAPLVLRERFSARTLGAVVVASCGLAALMAPGAGAADANIGVAYGAASAVFYAALVFLGKALGPSLTAAQLTCWPKLVSLPIYLAVALFSHGDHVAPSGASMGLLVGGGVVLGALSSAVYYSGLRHTRAATAAVLTLCEPLVAALTGILVWDEPAHLSTLVGGCCILGAGTVVALDPAGARDRGAQPSVTAPTRAVHGDGDPRPGE